MKWDVHWQTRKTETDRWGVSPAHVWFLQEDNNYMTKHLFLKLERHAFLWSMTGLKRKSFLWTVWYFSDVRWWFVTKQCYLQLNVSLFLATCLARCNPNTPSLPGCATCEQTGQFAQDFSGNHDLYFHTKIPSKGKEKLVRTWQSHTLNWSLVEFSLFLFPWFKQLLWQAQIYHISMNV